jgi:hypothetical protein
MIPIRHLMLGMLSAIAGNAGTIQFQSPDRQVSLVELYTSEGCSSCPPADAWLSRLKEKPGLWSEFVPIAFHVEYWDYLGWRDKWSSKEYSERQQDYAAAWGSVNIYTPEFILNGKEWHNWLQLRGVPGLSNSNTGVLKVSSEDTNHWQVSFVSTGGVTNAFEVNAALLVNGINSDVKAGENAGHHLQHDFVALKLVNFPIIRKDGACRGVFTMAAGQNPPPGRLALAVWVTPVARLDPLQSVGGWISPPDKDK